MTLGQWLYQIDAGDLLGSAVALAAILPGAIGLLITGREQRQKQASEVTVYGLQIVGSGNGPSPHEYHLINRSDRPVHYPVVITPRTRWWWPGHKYTSMTHLTEGSDNAELVVAELEPAGLVMPGQHVVASTNKYQRYVMFRDASGRRWTYEMSFGHLSYRRLRWWPMVYGKHLLPTRTSKLEEVPSLGERAPAAEPEATPSEPAVSTTVLQPGLTTAPTGPAVPAPALQPTVTPSAAMASRLPSSGQGRVARWLPIGRRQRKMMELVQSVQEASSKVVDSLHERRPR